MNTQPTKYNAPCASYLFDAFYDRRKNLNRAKRLMKKATFDSIVCTGVSGVLFASPLALLMGKNLVIVRKKKDGSHSHRQIEANVTPDKVGAWVFVDDLIDSGKTERRVKSEMKEWAGSFGTYVGKYLYEYGEFQTEKA